MKTLRAILSIPILMVGIPFVLIGYVLVALASLIAGIDFVSELEERTN